MAIQIFISHSVAPKELAIVNTVADVGIKILSQYKVIRIDRTAPLKTISIVSAKIQKLIRDEKTKNLVGGFVIGGLILLLLTSLKGE